MDALTFEALFTAAGAGALALLVRQIIQLVKAVLPAVDAAVSGALQAFILTAIAYVVAVATVPAMQTPNGILAAIVAWVTCATAAVGIDQAWNRVRASA
jgi:hypothetical protein